MVMPMRATAEGGAAAGLAALVVGSGSARVAAVAAGAGGLSCVDT
jgi:hypothetical protein